MTVDPLHPRTDKTQPPEGPTLPPRPPPISATVLPGPVRAGIPSRIGRYRVERLLGEGGMGAVYLAHDPELDRAVALKIPRLTGTQADARFLREARAAAALRHPNICPIHDLGEADGVRYLCLAYIRGETLSSRIGAGQLLPFADAVALVATIARAMYEAHRLGVIHRDLKPSNIMIDEAGRPVVMDFGLARPCTPLATQLTAAGEVLGTPAYMPPEQIEGAAERIGPACDIYALGIILYELLTGVVPFHGDLVALASQIVTDSPVPPSRRRLGIDSRLDAICLKALAKLPKERWPSMAAFADALDAVLDRAPAAGPALSLRIVGSPFAYRADARQGVVTIGRQRRRPDGPPDVGNDFVVRVTGNDELSLRISRRHLEIARTPTGFAVTAHGRGGTEHNGRPLPSCQPVPLSSGDRLVIAGALTLEVLFNIPDAGMAAATIDLPASEDFAARLLLEATTGDIVSLE
jgi:serine/threonine protein kinase